MTERELWEYFGKKVRVTGKNGIVIEGVAEYFSKAVDNVPEFASIGIPKNGGIVDIQTNEIAKIEILDD